MYSQGMSSDGKANCREGVELAISSQHARSLKLRKALLGKLLG
jgi:hypothetical protein